MEGSATMPSGSSGPVRIALYSHDTMGLGHARRNGLIASALAAAPLGAEVLMLTGAREAGTFPLPSGVDCVTLPAYRKGLDGTYTARSLMRATTSLTELRSQLIEAALDAFRPDVFIVDNVPRGALNELDPVLERLRHGGETRCVLGLRDILDEPEAVRRQWAKLDNEAVIERFFDAVWVYGDPLVNDVASAYGLAAGTQAKLCHIGYLDQRLRLADAAPLPPLPSGSILCCVGGGQDGAVLAQNFLEADLPPGRTGLLLTGPFMPAEKRRALEQRAAERPGFAVLPFIAEPIGHIARAERVIAMAGYNTVNEILSLGRPGLVVPRVRPRQEQLVRAQKLAALGLLDWLHPDDLDARALGDWLSRPQGERPDPRSTLDFAALERLPHLIDALLAPERRSPSATAAMSSPRRSRLSSSLSRAISLSNSSSHEGARHVLDPRAA